MTPARRKRLINLPAHLTPLARAVGAVNDLLRRGGDHPRSISPAWRAAVSRGRGAARSLLASSDADLEDIVAGAALRALADLARAGGGWTDLGAVHAYARREARSAALNLIRQRRGRATSRRRRADPLVYAERLCSGAHPASQVEEVENDDLLAAVLLAAACLPPSQRAAVACFLARAADPDRPPATPAERQAWSRARAALRARLQPHS